LSCFAGVIREQSDHHLQTFRHSFGEVCVPVEDESNGWNLFLVIEGVKKCEFIEEVVEDFFWELSSHQLVH